MKKNTTNNVIAMSERQMSMMITENVSNSIVSTDYKGPNVVCYAIEGNVVDRVSHKNGKGWCEDVSPTLNTQDRHAVVYAVENHPNDSRCTIDPDGIVQTLSGWMGTGGNNTPFVLIKNDPVMTPVCVMATSHWNAPFTDGSISPTLCARAGTGGNQLPLVALRIER